MQYRKDIDGLRAVAVLAVVLFHAKLQGFSGGFVGVDVFFVISGYLITGLIAQDWKAGRFSFATFYFRRIRRIVPALLCVYVACTLLALALMMPSDMAAFARSLASSATFVSNHYFYRLAGYFGGQSDLKPLLHTWSLSIEEQFYLVWPLLFLVVARWRFAWLPYVVWAVGAISLVAAAVMVGEHKEEVFFLAPFRAWELLLGAALALSTWRPALPAWMTELGAGAGLCMILASVLLLDESHDFPGLLAVPPCLGAALIILAGMERQPAVNRLLSTRPAAAIGLVSYSLYLWHWPLLSFARYHLDRPLDAVETGSILAASLAAAYLTYRYVEQPARHLTLVRMPQVIGAGILSLAAITLTGHLLAASRWTFNLDPEVRRLDAASTSRNLYRRSCSGPKNIFRDDEACTFGPPRSSASYDMAIFGDSHGDHYTPAMSVLAQQAGMSGRQITIGGCLALLGYYEITAPFSKEAGCRTLREAMVKFVESNPRLQVAVLAHNWSSYTGEKIWQDEGRIYLLGSKHDVRSPQRSLEVLRQSLEQTIDFFEAHGVHVVLLGEIPLFNHDPIRCIAAAVKQGLGAQSCRIPVSDVQGRIGAMNTLLADLARRSKNVSFFSPVDTMCDQQWCRPVMDGVYMYRDRGHLNRVGAEHLARSMRLAHMSPRS
jgi:peptidoglycan/LPS O-acetylase OafA/YrhL